MLSDTDTNLKNLTKSLSNYQLIRGRLKNKCQTWIFIKLYSRVLIFTKQVVSLDELCLKVTSHKVQRGSLDIHKHKVVNINKC